MVKIDSWLVDLVSYSILISSISTSLVEWLVEYNEDGEMVPDSVSISHLGPYS
jgi:hypothetical protein